MYSGTTRTNIKLSQPCRRCLNGQFAPAILASGPEDAGTAARRVRSEDSILLPKVYQRSSSNQTICLGRSAVPSYVDTKSLVELRMHRNRHFWGFKMGDRPILAGTCLRKASVTAAVTTVYHGIAVDMHVSPDIRLPVDNNNILRLVPAKASGHDTDPNYTPSGNKHEK